VSHGHETAVAGHTPNTFRGNAGAIVQGSGQHAVGCERILIYVKHDLEVFAAVSGACVACQVAFGQGDHAVGAGWPLGVGLLDSVLVNLVLESARPVESAQHEIGFVLLLGKMSLDRISVAARVLGGGRPTAAPALQIVGGVQDAAAGTGIESCHVAGPRLIAIRFDALERAPELASVWRRSLESLQCLTGKFIALAAEVDALLVGAGFHGAELTAVEAPLAGTTALAGHIISASAHACSQCVKTFGLLLGGDERRACRTVQSTNRRKCLVRGKVPV
jgi:hypothetical protein